MLFGEINRQRMKIINEHVVADTIDYLEARFAFSEEWNGLEKWVHFAKDGEVYDILSTFPVQPVTAFSACSDYAIINMVGMGLGVSILPELLVKNYAAGTAVLELDPPVSRTLGMGIPQMKTISPVTRSVMKYVEQYVKENG